MAVGMAQGPAAGLKIVEDLAKSPALATYPQLPAVRADLLERLGRKSEARADYERAASLTRNDRERDIFLVHAQRLRLPAEVLDP